MRAELDAVDDPTEQVELPKRVLRKALNCVRNHWTELTQYLGDADLLSDNDAFLRISDDTFKRQAIVVVE